MKNKEETDYFIHTYNAVIKRVKIIDHLKNDYVVIKDDNDCVCTVKMSQLFKDKEELIVHINAFLNRQLKDLNRQK